MILVILDSTETKASADIAVQTQNTYIKIKSKKISYEIIFSQPLLFLTFLHLRLYCKLFEVKSVLCFLFVQCLT